MKQIISICMAAAMILSVAACGSPATADSTSAHEVTHVEESEMQTDRVDQENKSNILVAYFSLADEQYEVGVIEKGNTEIVAEMIAETTGADSFKIERTTPYPTTYDELLDESRREDDDPPEIVGTVENMDSYDTVFIGYPIWWGDLPGIVRVFLGSYEFSGKTVIPFCTHAGSGLSGTQSSVESLCPGASVQDGLAIRGRDAQNEQEGTRTQVMQWLGELGYVS